MCDFLSEEDREVFITVSRTPYTYSITKALQSLDQYPWFQLVPVEILPEFQNKILSEVKRLGGKSAIERREKRLNMLSRLQINSPMRKKISLVVPDPRTDDK